MLLSFNVLLIQKYGWKTLIERNIYKANLISPVKRKIFFQIFFRLMDGMKYLDFFRLILLFFNVCLIQNHGLKILIEKNYIKKN